MYLPTYFFPRFFSLMISVEIQSDSWHWSLTIWCQKKIENIAIREVWTLENFKIHDIFFLVVVSLLEINEYIKQGDLFASVKFVFPSKLISRRSMKRNYSDALLHVLKLKFFRKMSYFLLES